MPRPQKNTVDYFPHDNDASEGRTLSILYNNFGHEGISCWWQLLERVSKTRNHVISLRNSEDLEFLAAKLRLVPERLKEILEKMADLEAIDSALFRHDLIWVTHFVERVEQVYKTRKMDLPTKPELSEEETELISKETELSTPISTQSKLKETKVKKSIYIPYQEFANVNKMTKEEHQKLIERFGEAGTRDKIENLSLYIASKGDKYKNHYATILAWEKRDGANQNKLGKVMQPGEYPNPDELRNNAE